MYIAILKLMHDQNILSLQEGIIIISIIEILLNLKPMYRLKLICAVADLSLIHI